MAPKFLENSCIRVIYVFRDSTYDLYIPSPVGDGGRRSIYSIILHSWKTTMVCSCCGRSVRLILSRKKFDFVDWLQSIVEYERDMR